MNADAIKPILERDRSSAVETKPTGVWPGWGRRRIVMSYYFGGQFLASLLFAVMLRLTHPLYTEVHYQLVALQSIGTLVAILWFVPAMVNDFGRAIGGSNLKLAAGGLSSAVWPLAKNILYIGLFAGGASLPIALLFPSNEVVGRFYYTDSFHFTWGFHVLIASILLAAFTVAVSGIGVALLMIFRSLMAYRLVIATMILASLMHPWLAYDLLAGSGIVLRYKRFLDIYGLLGSFNYPGYFSDFVRDIDGGSFLLNYIPSLTGRIIVALLLRIVGSGLLLVICLWIGASLSTGFSVAFRRKPVLAPRRLVARPALAFFTGIAVLGLAASLLLHNTSYLMITNYRTGAQGTPYDLMLLTIMVVTAYLVISASADALQSTGRSGLGDSLPTVVWRLQRAGIGLILAMVFAGAAYLSLFAKIAGYSLTTFAAGVALLLFFAAATMTLAAGVLVLGRLTHGFWGVAASLQGFAITIAAALSAFFLFTKDSPSKLVMIEGGDPAQASLYAGEIARLAASSYPALVHSWLRAFDAGASSIAGLVQLSFAVLAACAAVALALGLIARLTRRLA